MKVIDPKYLPHNVTPTNTVLIGLLMDRFHAPAAAWYIVGTLAVIFWIVYVSIVWRQEHVHPDDLGGKR